MKKMLLPALAMIALICGSTWLFINKDKPMNDLTQTDPELSELWNNFISKEVQPHSNLNAQTRYLLLLAAHVATQSPEEFRLILNRALDDGVSPIEIKEAVYQTIPYAGMAKTYDFLLLTNRILSERGVKLPLAAQSTTTTNTRLEQGIRTQQEIFGTEHIDTMRANAPEELKHIQDYLSANCFGDYYTRTGLDIKTRELLTFATLASLGGTEAQMRAHVQGNLNVGNNRQLLLDTVTQLLPFIGYPRSLNAIAAINDITSKQ